MFTIDGEMPRRDQVAFEGLLKMGESSPFSGRNELGTVVDREDANYTQHFTWVDLS